MFECLKPFFSCIIFMNLFHFGKEFLARLNILADSGFRNGFSLCLFWQVYSDTHKFFDMIFENHDLGKIWKKNNARSWHLRTVPRKTCGLFFWGVIREKVSAFTLIYLFDMPNKRLLLRFFSDYYHVLTLSMSKMILRGLQKYF